MKKFWKLNLETKSLIISSIITVLGFLGTSFLFWFHRYDIPLSVLTGGGVVVLTWLFLYLNSKNGHKNPKLDIVLIYIRLTMIVLLAIIVSVIEMTLKVVTISPIFLVISYLVVSLFNFLAYIKKGENDV